MESVDRRMILAGAGLVGVAALSRMSKAGPLDPPPGPIGPTGKTLQEIYDKVSSTNTKVAVSDQGVSEPRTPIRSLPSSGDAQFVITQPGAYCLTDNIDQVPGVTCIDIQCSDVDIDGQGFAFVGTGDSGVSPSPCIRAQGRKNIEIYDCTFSGWSGPQCDCPESDQVYVSDCAIRGCSNPGDAATGTGGYAILARNNCEISDCDIVKCSGGAVVVGDASYVFDLTVTDNIGLSSFVRCGNGCCVDSCSAQNLSIQGGQLVAIIRGGDRSCVTECDIRNCTGLAVEVGSDCVVECCEVTGGSGGGYLCGNRCSVEDSTCTMNAGRGLIAGTTSCVTECDVRQCSDTAITVGAGSVIECCEVTGGSGGGYLCGDACTVEDSTCISHNGAAILCGASCCVTECDCRNVSGGVGAVVTTGPNSVVECCEVTGGSGGAYHCADGCCIEDCTAMSHEGVAIECGSRCTIDSNKAMLCWGIDCAAECVVCDNEASVSGGGGAGGAINVFGERCCITGNYVSSGGIALFDGSNRCLVEDNHVTGAGGTPGTGGGTIFLAASVTGCHVRDNHVSRASTTQAFVIPPGNSHGPIVNCIGGGDLSLIPNGGHPHGNFIYS